MFQEYPVSLVKLSFFFIQVKIIQVLDFDNWHPLNRFLCDESFSKEKLNLNKKSVDFEIL